MLILREPNFQVIGKGEWVKNCFLWCVTIVVWAYFFCEVSNFFKVGSHEGTCCRDMLRGRISCAVHTKGHVAGIGFLKCSHGGSCCRGMSWFRFLIGLFSEVSQGHVAWTVHTRQHLNVVLSPRHVPSIQTDLNSWDMLWGQNFVPTTRKSSVHTMGLQHVPSCVPTFKVFQASATASWEVTGLMNIEHIIICWHNHRLTGNLQYSQAVPHIYSIKRRHQISTAVLDTCKSIQYHLTLSVLFISVQIIIIQVWRIICPEQVGWIEQWLNMVVVTWTVRLKRWRSWERSCWCSWWWFHTGAYIIRYQLPLVDLAHLQQNQAFVNPFTPELKKYILLTF